MTTAISHPFGEESTEITELCSNCAKEQEIREKLQTYVQKQQKVIQQLQMDLMKWKQASQVRDQHNEDDKVELEKKEDEILIIQERMNQQKNHFEEMLRNLKYHCDSLTQENKMLKEGAAWVADLMYDGDG